MNKYDVIKNSLVAMRKNCKDRITVKTGLVRVAHMKVGMCVQCTYYKQNETKKTGR